MKMTFQEIRIIATGPCIANQLRDVNTICKRSWYIAAHIWKIYDLYLSQMIRYSRACGSYQDFLDRGLLRKIYGRHHDLVDLYGISRSWYIAAHIWKIYDFKKISESSEKRFEDAKGAIRNYISKKNRQHNGPKKVQKDKQRSIKHTH
jgi:hypothetical protein